MASFRCEACQPFDRYLAIAVQGMEDGQATTPIPRHPPRQSDQLLVERRGNQGAGSALQRAV